MAKNTMSNQFDYREESISFDLYTYRLCKRYLATKDDNLCLYLIKKIIASQSAQGRNQIRLLDLGAGEGVFIGKLLWKLTKSLECPLVDVVESDEESFAQLTRMARSPEFRQNIVKLWCATAFDALQDKPSPSYDVILMTHLLYHLRKTEWAALLERCARALSPRGRVFITLVRRDSEIFEAFPELYHAAIDRLGGDILHGNGSFYFADDLREILASLDIAFRSRTIDGKVIIAGDDLATERSLVQTGNIEASGLVRFLSFMFRLEPYEVVALSGDRIRELVIHSGSRLDFVSSDDVFELGSHISKERKQ